MKGAKKQEKLKCPYSTIYFGMHSTLLSSAITTTTTTTAAVADNSPFPHLCPPSPLQLTNTTCCSTTLHCVAVKVRCCQLSLSLSPAVCFVQFYLFLMQQLLFLFYSSLFFICTHFRIFSYSPPPTPWGMLHILEILQCAMQCDSSMTFCTFS